MPRYFIQTGGKPYEEVTEDQYLLHAGEARLNNFYHGVSQIDSTGRFRHSSVIGKICETHEQVEALLSGQKVE